MHLVLIHQMFLNFFVSEILCRHSINKIRHFLQSLLPIKDLFETI